jgi:hypothetical protein
MRALAKQDPTLVDPAVRVMGRSPTGKGCSAPSHRPAPLALLAGRLVFTPRGDGDERNYEFEGPATLGKVFAGIVIPKSVVTPAGFEPAISTLKGSRPGPG